MTLKPAFTRRDLAYLILATALAVGAYLLFRVMYFASETVPFAQEITLVFLGAVATIYLTAVLLNRQTELELRKEGRVIVLQQKADIYMACVEKVAELVENKVHDPELIAQLRILTHKLAIVGSGPTVKRFCAVLDRLLEGLKDGGMSTIEGNEVMNALANLTAAMRSDILSEAGVNGNFDLTEEIQRNSRRVEAIDDL